ncbi:3-oxoacyl-ACP synthase III family protein [Aquimarina hainanensis]|uniref:3-oxoacyl-ACP synthase III family protein n=1 Tax=Aquimarina hainanensis TaxID=1578017 RepID=A0ABW5N8B1_9FLAO
MNNVSIIGSGSYVPENIVTNKDLEKTLDTTDEWIVQKTGIKERRIAPADMLTSDMAAYAARNALSTYSINPEDIDLIVLATNMSDHLSPACAVKVQEKIGAINACAFDIRVGGCPGIIYAMSVAYQYIASGTYKTVLALSADMNSKVVNWEDRKTCVFLGDGASAFVLQQSERPGIKNIKLHTSPKGYYDAFIPAGGIAEPITTDNITSGRQYFTMNGRNIWEYATTVFPATVHELLEEGNLDIEDVNFVIPHQANLNIIKEGLRQLAVPLEKTIINVDRYANTGGSSVGIAFAEGIEKGIIKKGDTIILVAFGAGYSWGGMLLELH